MPKNLWAYLLLNLKSLTRIYFKYYSKPLKDGIKQVDRLVETTHQNN